MKNFKPKVFVYFFAILGVSALCSFSVPTKQKEKALVYSQSLPDDYEDVLEDIEEIKRQLDEVLMTESEKLEWTPGLVILAQAHELLALGVAAVRVAAALSRAATPALRVLGQAAQAAGTVYNLLTTLISKTKISKPDDIKFLKEMEAYNMYKLC